MGRLGGRSHQDIPQTRPSFRENLRLSPGQSGRTLYTFTDHEMSLLRDCQLNSIDGIGRERTLPARYHAFTCRIGVVHTPADRIGTCSYMGSTDWNRGKRVWSRPPDFTEIKERPVGTNKPEYPSVCDFSRSANQSPVSLKSSPKSPVRHSSGALGLEPSRIAFAVTPSRFFESAMAAPTAGSSRWSDGLEHASSVWSREDLEAVSHLVLHLYPSFVFL